MQWTDRIRQVKILLVIAAILIAVTSLLVSHYLVKDLSREERKKMEVWAQALHALNQADENTDLTLVLDVIQGNTTIPVIVIDSNGHVNDYRNIDLDDKTATDSEKYVSDYGRRLYKSGKYIRIHLGDSTKTNDYQLVCYDESTLLKRLSQYPYWQLGIVMIFDIRRRCHFCTTLFKKSRTEQSVGRSFKRDCPPIRHTYFQSNGLGRSTEREPS